MTKSTIRVAIDVGSKSHWVGVGLSEGQVLERFSPTFPISTSGSVFLRPPCDE